jgi:hypothetical protein
LATFDFGTQIRPSPHILLFGVQKQKERNWQPWLSECKLGFPPTYVIILGAKTKRAKMATFDFGTQIRHFPHILLLFWVQKLKEGNWRPSFWNAN